MTEYKTTSDVKKIYPIGQEFGKDMTEYKTTLDGMGTSESIASALANCTEKYRVIGEPLPVLVCMLEAGESMICQKGAMSWMTPNMQMETVSGGLGKIFGRMFSGESLFQNRYTARDARGLIGFASSLPGVIRRFDIKPGFEIVAQKTAFLASTTSVDLSIFFQKKIGAGFFGGEGFIMQKLSGTGTAFIEIDGAAVEYNLGDGESMIIDTGYLAAMSATCKMDIKMVGGIKNTLLGGEGLFNTVVTGPGHIILQSMPVTKLVSALAVPKR